MRKNLIIGGAVVALVGLASAMFLLQKDNTPAGDLVDSTECSTLCEQANAKCPSLIDTNSCLSRCSSFSDEMEEYISQADSCEDFSAQPELLSELVVPEINTPELKPASSDCEAACGNYVTLCLMLVPGASEELFSDGLDSCLGECATWDAPKVECMINSFDCPAMTNVCGL